MISAPGPGGASRRDAGAQAGGAASARAVLGRYGKTFRLAGWLLPGRVLDGAALLYAFCREVDDIADEAADPDMARARLVALHRALQEEDHGDALAATFLQLRDGTGVPLEPALLLVRTVTSDLGTVRIEDEAQLIQYANGVAGTVGMMMCPILGARDAGAVQHATHLGIAMQLTNIARDVVEDAARGRTYLPAAWHAHASPDASPNASQGPATPSQDELFAVVRRVVELAGTYYRHGNEGLRYLPARVRPGVLAASRIYQEIGVEILRRGPAYLTAGRCVVAHRRKLALAAWCLLPRPHLRSRAPAVGRPGVRA